MSCPVVHALERTAIALRREGCAFDETDLALDLRGLEAGDREVAEHALGCEDCGALLRLFLEIHCAVSAEIASDTAAAGEDSTEPSGAAGSGRERPAAGAVPSPPPVLRRLSLRPASAGAAGDGSAAGRATAAPSVDRGEAREADRFRRVPPPRRIRAAAQDARTGEQARHLAARPELTLTTEDERMYVRILPRTSGRGAVAVLLLSREEDGAAGDPTRFGLEVSRRHYWFDSDGLATLPSMPGEAVQLVERSRP